MLDVVAAVAQALGDVEQQNLHQLGDAFGRFVIMAAPYSNNSAIYFDDADLKLESSAPAHRLDAQTGPSSFVRIRGHSGMTGCRKLFANPGTAPAQ